MNRPEFKLDPSIKTKWLAGLRHGNFAQCRGTLFNGHAYCCLGVGVAVIGAHDFRDKEPSFYRTISAGRALGLSIDARDYLVHLNDTLEWTFAQIADEIEAHF